MSQTEASHYGAPSFRRGVAIAGRAAAFHARRIPPEADSITLAAIRKK